MSKLNETEVLGLYNDILNGKIDNFPCGFWANEYSKEYALICFKYLIEDIFEFTKDDIKKQLNNELLLKYKLKGAVYTAFSGMHELVQALYPDIKPWQLKVSPKGFWESDENIAIATRWLIEEELKLDGESIKTKLSTKDFKKNGLSGALSKKNGSLYALIDNAYKGKFQPWELKCVPTGYWESEYNRLKAMDWLFNEKLKWTDDEIRDNFDFNVVANSGLRGLICKYYNHSPYMFLNAYYHGKFCEWELKQTAKGFWNIKENRRRSIEWFLDKNNIDKDNPNFTELKKLWTTDNLKKSGLNGLIKYHKYNIFDSLDEYYPDLFKVWQIKSHLDNYWDLKENRVKAIRDLISKNNWNRKNVVENITPQIFIDNGLGKMLKYKYKNNVYLALQEGFEEEYYQPWEFKHGSIPKGYWKEINNQKNALLWLCRVNNIDKNELKLTLSVSYLRLNNLDGLLKEYKYSVREIQNKLLPTIL